MPENVRARLGRSLSGAATGFFLGIVAGLPLGVVGLYVPLVGLVVGAILGGTASQRLCQWFFNGYVLGGIGTAIMCSLLLRWEDAGVEPSASWKYGIGFISAVIGNGGALLGGVVAAVAAKLIPPGSGRPWNPLLLLPVGLACFLAVFLANAAIDAKAEHVSEQRAATEQAQRNRERERLKQEWQRRVSAGERSLPAGTESLLYPNRESIDGDSFQIVMVTGDTPEVVADYYRRLVSVQFVQNRDPSTSAPSQDGKFMFQGILLHLRIVVRSYKAGGYIPHSETRIFLNAVPAR